MTMIERSWVNWPIVEQPLLGQSFRARQSILDGVKQLRAHLKNRALE